MEFVDKNGVEFTLDRKYVIGTVYNDTTEYEGKIELDVTLEKFFLAIGSTMYKSLNTLERIDNYKFQDYIGLSKTRITDGEIISEEITRNLYNELKLEDYDNIPGHLLESLVLEAILNKNKGVTDKYFNPVFSETLSRNPLIFISQKSNWIYPCYAPNLKVQPIIRIFSNSSPKEDEFKELLSFGSGPLVLRYCRKHKDRFYPLCQVILHIQKFPDIVPILYKESSFRDNHIIEAARTGVPDIIKKVISLGCEIPRKSNRGWYFIEELFLALLLSVGTISDDNDKTYWIIQGNIVRYSDLYNQIFDLFGELEEKCKDQMKYIFTNSSTKILNQVIAEASTLMHSRTISQRYPYDSLHRSHKWFLILLHEHRDFCLSHLT